MMNEEDANQEKSSTELRAYKVGTKHLETVAAYAGPNKDIAGIFGALRMESGLDYENLEKGG